MGNSLHISDRISAHRRCVFGLTFAGLAKAHRANPAAVLRIEQIYGLPTLLSGMGALNLSVADEKLIDGYYKVHLQRILKLHQATPACFVYFAAGSIPASARLHLRMFSIFGQVCRIQEGENILSHQASRLRNLRLRLLVQIFCNTSTMFIR